jgi:hypothetical protein
VLCRHYRPSQPQLRKPRRAVRDDCSRRAAYGLRGEIMGSRKCRIVGKSQSVLGPGGRYPAHSCVISAAAATTPIISHATLSSLHTKVS